LTSSDGSVLRRSRPLRRSIGCANWWEGKDTWRDRGR